MKQNYFIVVLAHSMHGRLRRVHIPHTFLYAILGLAVLGCFSVFGFVSSYVRMAGKVANYNALRDEAQVLKQRYQNLQKVVNQTDEQLASLKILANEVSVAYGIKRTLEGPDDLSAEARLIPTFKETLDDYSILRTSTYAKFDRNYLKRFGQRSMQPSLWPVEGRFQGAFGHRLDPFSGEGAYHRGVDISAPHGTPVKATADGIVVHAGWMGGYGRLVVVDHGGGIETFYAHLSRMDAIEGAEVRQGDMLGRVGTTGRSTSPHLHYEVRVGHAPVNPWRYLRTAAVTVAAKRDLPF
ncbi:MAG: M23 family metallopeptidase [Bryobacteraceae bacterium]